MAKRPPPPDASPFVPESPTLKKLQAAAKDCTACDLHKTGTQTVFGEGRAKPKIMFVGEQPGNSEDLAGHPFVGPAGNLLNHALEAAGIDRDLCYVTNVVKHFKWISGGGKRRIHQKPNAKEIHACRPWLDAEIRTLKPKVIVCLGATAAQAVIGKHFKVTQQRGELLKSELAEGVMATVHPSSILRAPDEETRRRETEAFILDLSKLKPWAGE